MVQIRHPKKGVNFVKYGNEHQALGSKRLKLTFSLKDYCLFLLFGTVVITATCAQMGLFSFSDIF